MEKYSLTYPQKNIWLVEKFNGNIPINTIAGTIEIKNNFDEKICSESIEYVIRTNDAMRFRFTEDLDIVQYLNEYEDANIKIYDLSSYTKEQIENYKEDIVKEPLNILNNKLFEFYILRYSKNSGCILMKIHHIISDAWSCSKIGTDMIKFMNSKINNKEFIEENRPSYIEYIKSEKEYEASEKYIKDRDFWNDYLKDIKEPISLKMANENTSKEAKRYSVILSDEENLKINKYCKNNKISPYALFLAALSTYMYRVTGNNDLIIGTPVLNRSNFKEKNMVGMFVSTLPLRVIVNEDEKFIDLVKDISLNNLSLFRHQKYPYSKTLEYIHQNTNIKSNLYNVVLSYQNARTDIGESENYSTTWIFNKKLNDELQIHITDMDNTGKLNINYDYLSKLFDDVEIKYIHTRIMAIILDAIENLDVSVENIRIMSKEEENKILYEFNDTDTNYPKDKTVIELFEEQVKKTPNNIALVFEDKQITYKELNEKANRLAHFLKEEKKIVPGDKVCILQKRGLNILISILGILKAGGVYIPIDPEFPMERIQYMFENSDSKYILVQNNENVFTNNYININNLTLDEFSNTNLDLKLDLNNPVYYIYTSGTTGLPKGVVVLHKNLVNLCFAAIEFQELNKCDIWGAFSSYSFDISILETFIPLTIGKEIVYANEEQQKNPEKMGELIINNNIEVIYMTPSRMHLLIDYDKLGKSIKFLKRILLGGEEFPKNFFNKLREFTDARIYDGYGPTEITVWSSAKEIENENNINIGKPLCNMKSLIVDEKLRLLPIFCKGELIVGGNGVAKEYYKNEILTNEKFVSIYGGRFYRTGDISCYNDLGELQFYGRKDFQVKLHGYRIEINEIENTIKSFDNIDQAVVVIENEKLYAYFSSNKYIAYDELKKYLKTKLPYYMMPIFYMQVNKFEFNVLGKIDRKKLPKFQIKNSEYIAPRTITEINISKCIKKILNIRKIGIDDNIFEVGIDSLNVINLLAELNKLNFKLTYSDIYDLQTIRKISEFLDNSRISTYNERVLSNYDYTLINNELKDNIVTNIEDKLNKNNLGNVLLFGATGFFGMHFLDKFLTEEKGIIYCVVRPKFHEKPIERINERLKYYFGNKHLAQVGKRIKVLDADIRSENFNLAKTLLNELIENIDVCVNASSRVTHFGDEKIFYDINVDSSKNIADFCFKNNKKLIYISTLSVSGNTLEGGYIDQRNIKNKINFDESKFYINQILNNVYTNTKFLAERYLIDLRSKGLNVKIMRLGNLTSSIKYNKFQINSDENAFANRLKAVIELKVIPKSLKNLYLEFTPVDYAADAVLKLSRLDSKYFMFHIFNHNHIDITEFISIMKQNNINIKFISDKQFSKIIEDYKSDYKKIKKISGIIIDIDKNNNLNYLTNIIVKSDYTINILKKNNFKWPKITKDYIIEYLKTILGEEF